MFTELMKGAFKFGLIAATAGTLCMAKSAQASEDRLTVSEIYNFIELKEDAINTLDRRAGKTFLDRNIASSAVFENRIANYNGAYNHYVPAFYGQQNHWRYPQVAGYVPTSYNALSKWQYINVLQDKKARIPGFKADIEVTKINIRPFGQSAIVDLDINEESMAYTGYHVAYGQQLTQRVVHSKSKCKAYIAQNLNNEAVLTRLDCNTNSAAF
jgi:hypothetical protein